MAGNVTPIGEWSLTIRGAGGNEPLEIETFMVSVNHDDLNLAFAFVNSGPPMEHNAYISLDTGRIHWVSDLNPVDEELPEDFETSDRYVALPHKNDLGLGRNLALGFVAQELPTALEDVEAIFRRKGGLCSIQGQTELSWAD